MSVAETESRAQRLHLAVIGPVGVSMISTPAAAKSSSYFILVSIRAAHMRSGRHGRIFLLLHPCCIPTDGVEKMISSGLSSCKEITVVGTRNGVLLMAAFPAAENEGCQHAE